MSKLLNPLSRVRLQCSSRSGKTKGGTISTVSLPLLRFWFHGGKGSVETISSSGRDSGCRCGFCLGMRRVGIGVWRVVYPYADGKGERGEECVGRGVVWGGYGRGCLYKVGSVVWVVCYTLRMRDGGCVWWVVKDALFFSIAGLFVVSLRSPLSLSPSLYS